VVVFTHVPMWTVYADWGWGTDDSAQAMALLGRFGSVTVLNGHIHQVIQKVEGNVAFHTARSTAFPQPAPGQGPSPGPLKVPAGELRAALGVRTVTVTRGTHPLGRGRRLARHLNRFSSARTSHASDVSPPLAGVRAGRLRGRHAGRRGAASIPMHAMHAPTSMKTAASAPAPGHAAAPEATLVKVVASAPAIVKIGNFTFGPGVLTVAPGTTVTWVNEDDIPHTGGGQRQVLPIEGDGHRRPVLDDLRQTGDVRVFLLDPSAHDRQGRGKAP
jgi:plastocyanin